MMKRFLLFLLVFAILIPAGVVFAQSKICISQSGTCTKEEVGAFMQGISSDCGNAGACELRDIEIVFINVANFILSIIGALVLLMYIIGGIYFLTAGGSQERISKGKQYFKFSSLGLLIVLFAFIGVITLKNAITTGEIACSVGEDCGDNMTCSKFGECITECQNKYGTDQGWACTDINKRESEKTGCDVGLCPGESNIMCCPPVTNTPEATTKPPSVTVPLSPLHGAPTE
jgi:hypothetical protein